ncbi:unnamed protein product [Clavelina lepadiformis]|uniref:Uncharacterized protein n=1 Tax=Clavelina lepadiformis TaxID=159417 RepID=A0ABP0FIC9_CLALP
MTGFEIIFKNHVSRRHLNKETSIVEIEIEADFAIELVHRMPELVAIVNAANARLCLQLLVGVTARTFSTLIKALRDDDVIASRMAKWISID